MIIANFNENLTTHMTLKNYGPKNNNKFKPKFLDAPVAWGLYFQDAASPSFEGIVDLHNRIMFYLVVILFGVSWVLISLITNFNTSNNKLVYRHLNHGKYVPVHKCSKFKITSRPKGGMYSAPLRGLYTILKSKTYISLRLYSTISGSTLNINEIHSVKVYEDTYLNRVNILEEIK